MITLDWDEPDNLFFRISQLKLMFAETNVEIYFRKSASKGYHIKIMGVKNDYDLRKRLWDDQKRIEIDKEREKLGLPINILFDQKVYPDGEVKRAGIWRRIN